MPMLMCAILIALVVAFSPNCSGAEELSIQGDHGTFEVTVRTGINKTEGAKAMARRVWEVMAY